MIDDGYFLPLAKGIRLMRRVWSGFSSVRVGLVGTGPSVSGSVRTWNYWEDLSTGCALDWEALGLLPEGGGLCVAR
jgi:hypothetical protein